MVRPAPPPTSVPTHPGVQTHEPQEVQSSLSQRALKMRSAHYQLIGVWLFVLALLLLGSATCLGPAVLLLLSTQAPPSQQASTHATFSAVTHGLAAGALAMHGYLLKQGRASTVKPVVLAAVELATYGSRRPRSSLRTVAL